MAKWEAPSSAKIIDIPSMTKGLFTDIPATDIPDDGLSGLENAYVSNQGVIPFLGWTDFDAGNSIPRSETSIGYYTAVDSSGASFGYLFTANHIYRHIMGGPYTRVDWSYHFGTVSTSGSTITGSGTLWVTNDVKPGDRIQLGSMEYDPDSATYYTILSVNSETSITVTPNPPTVSSYSYCIDKNFMGAYGTIGNVDVIFYDDYFIIADGKHQLIHLIGNLADILITDVSKYPSSTPFVPCSVSYYGNRIWVGGLTDTTDGYVPNRIRWSSLANPLDFSATTSWIDLDTTSQVQKILGLEDVLMIYTKTNILIGVATSIATAPYVFNRIESGGVGIHSNGAVISYEGSHILMTEKGPYKYDTSNGLVPIDCPVLRAFLSYYIERSFIAVEPFNNLICFSISDYSGIIGLYLFNYKSGSWGICAISSDFVTSLSVASGVPAYRNLPTLIVSTHPTASTTALKYRPLNLLGSASGIVRLFTKDFTFGDGSDKCIYTRFDIHLRNQYTSAQSFYVYGSTDGGLTYKYLGPISIPAGKYQGYINFRLLGSRVRFKISWFTTAYGIIESYSIQLRKVGPDLSISRS